MLLGSPSRASVPLGLGFPTPRNTTPPRWDSQRRGEPHISCFHPIGVGVPKSHLVGMLSAVGSPTSHGSIPLGLAFPVLWGSPTQCHSSSLGWDSHRIDLCSLLPSRGSSRIEEACDIYARAANMFKMAKNWSGTKQKQHREEQHFRVGRRGGDAWRWDGVGCVGMEGGHVEMGGGCVGLGGRGRVELSWVGLGSC